MGWEPCPADLPGLGLVYNLRNYGARINGTTDDTAAVNRAVAAAGKTGGTVVVPPSLFPVLISSTINVPSNVTFHRTWEANYLPGDAPVSGKFLWNGPINTAMFHIGDPAGRQAIAFDGISWDGNGVAGVTGVDLQAGAAGAGGTRLVTFDHWGFYNLTTAVQVGQWSVDGNDWVIDQVSFGPRGIVNTCTYGIVVDSLNAMDDGVIGSFEFVAGTHAVWLKRCGLVRLVDLLGAGPVGTTPAFIRMTTSNRATVVIENCECEQFTTDLWFDVTGGDANGNYPITMIGNVWDGGVQMDAAVHVIGIGNVYNGATIQVAVSGIYDAYGESLLAGTTVSVGANGFYTEHAQTLSVPTVAAGTANGSTPPAPVRAAGTDRRGRISFGTGIGATAGQQVVVTFGTPLQQVPYVMITPLSGTAQYGTGLAAAATVNGFIVSFDSIPLSSQPVGTYMFEYAVSP